MKHFDQEILRMWTLSEERMSLQPASCNYGIGNVVLDGLLCIILQIVGKSNKLVNVT